MTAAKIITFFFVTYFFKTPEFIVVLAFVANVVYTMNFYFNAIKKKLQEGYVPADTDTTAILRNAGLVDGTSSAVASPSFQNAPNTNGVTFCSACGAKIENGSKFCAKCGKPV